MTKTDLFQPLLIFAILGFYKSLTELRNDIVNGHKPWRTLDEVRRSIKED